MGGILKALALLKENNPLTFLQEKVITVITFTQDKPDFAFRDNPFFLYGFRKNETNRLC